MFADRPSRASYNFSHHYVIQSTLCNDQSTSAAFIVQLH